MEWEYNYHQKAEYQHMRLFGEVREFIVGNYFQKGEDADDEIIFPESC